MKKLLHIIASPREEASRTLQVSHAFLKEFQEKHPKCEIDTLDLAREHLPDLTMKAVNGKYILLSGKELEGEFKAAWEGIVKQINRFLAADMYVISTPMWNFSIPYRLKHYIDLIVQPRYLFRYTEQGTVEGLAKNKKMVIVCSRGGDYSSPQMASMDFQEPYLKTIFNFVGIKDLTFITAEPMDKDKALQKEHLKEAQEEATQLASTLP